MGSPANLKAGDKFKKDSVRIHLPDPPFEQPPEFQNDGLITMAYECRGSNETGVDRTAYTVIVYDKNNVAHPKTGSKSGGSTIRNHN